MNNFNIEGSINSNEQISGNIMETILAGLSAYEVAVKNGYEGTETEWLYSLGVHVEVVVDEQHEYILKVITGDNEFLTPNLKPILERGVDYMTPEDMEYILNEIYSNLDNKYVELKEGYSLVKDTEIERLSKVDNYNDTEIKELINDISNDLDEVSDDVDYLTISKVDKKDGYSLISDEEINRLKDVKNYDDADIKNDINSLQNTKANQSDLDEHKNNNIIHITDEEREKWNTLPSKTDIGLGNVDNTSDINKPVSTLQQTAINSAKDDANDYTDEKINALVNNAPETLNTLKKIADAINEDKETISNLEEEIENKTDKTDFENHINDTIIHVDPTEKELWNSKSTVTVNQATIETTPIAASISIDGVTYKIVGGGSGGGNVDSVNGKIGTVILTAEDVGALPDTTTIPSSLADLESDDEHRTVTDEQISKWDEGSGSSTAEETSYEPNGIIASTNVQSAIDTIVGAGDNVVSYKIKTGSNGGTSANIKVTCQEKLINDTIYYNQVQTTPKIYDLFSVQYRGEKGGWTITALDKCIYDGRVYQAGEVVKVWLYSVIVDFSVSEVPKPLFTFYEEGKSLVSDEQIETWNNKSDFDGNYESLTNKPEEETENIDFSKYFEGGN